MSNGVIVGSIMPAIIAAHIAHSSSSRGASQVTVIIHADAPVIGPYMSRAMATTHAQQASGTTATRTMSVSDGRPSAASTTVFTYASALIVADTVQERPSMARGLEVGRDMVTTILLMVGFVALSIGVMLATAVAVFSPQLNESKELPASSPVVGESWHRVA